MSCASLLIAAGMSVALVKYDHSPAITTVLIVLGFPGFAFAMMIYPGVHADKPTMIAAMAIVNALFYVLVIYFLTKLLRRRRMSDAAEINPAQSNARPEPKSETHRPTNSRRDG